MALTPEEHSYYQNKYRQELVRNEELEKEIQKRSDKSYKLWKGDRIVQRLHGPDSSNSGGSKRRRTQ